MISILDPIDRNNNAEKELRKKKNKMTKVEILKRMEEF